VNRAPDFPAPILGWRTWLVVRRGEGLRLTSVVQPTVWEPRRELVSECLAQRRLLSLRRRRHRDVGAPDAECSCGIYAASDAEFAGQYAFDHGLQRRDAEACAIGQVSLWGRVLRCPRGWRAEFAYPARLFVPIRADDTIATRWFETLAFDLTEYGVPVELLSHRGERDLVHSLA
jgi:hypothetical protein